MLMIEFIHESHTLDLLMFTNLDKIFVLCPNNSSENNNLIFRAFIINVNWGS